MTLDEVVKPSKNEIQFEEKFEKPIFVETFPQSINVFTGESVKFECIVSGKPTPKVIYII